MLTLFIAALTLARPSDLLTPPRDNTRVVVRGTGTVHPTDNDLVKVRYVVWDQEGKILDQAIDPRWSIVEVKAMTPAWRADIMKMVAGEHRRTWVAEDKVVMDTELLTVIPRPATPADVAAPPADAVRTSSGLAYKILRPGKGVAHPKHGDRVLVHYTGWTTDGMMFDSSYVRGDAMQLPVDGGILGWTEAVQLMTSGSKARFWMPEKLAYAGMEGKPKGMIVFDIEVFTVSSEIPPKRGKGGYSITRPTPGLPPGPPIPGVKP